MSSGTGGTVMAKDSWAAWACAAGTAVPTTAEAMIMLAIRRAPQRERGILQFIPYLLLWTRVVLGHDHRLGAEPKDDQSKPEIRVARLPKALTTAALVHRRRRACAHDRLVNIAALPADHSPSRSEAAARAQGDAIRMIHRLGRNALSVSVRRRDRALEVWRLTGDRLGTVDVSASTVEGR